MGLGLNCIDLGVISRHSAADDVYTVPQRLPAGSAPVADSPILAHRSLKNNDEQGGFYAALNPRTVTGNVTCMYICKGLGLGMYMRFACCLFTSPSGLHPASIGQGRIIDVRKFPSEEGRGKVVSLARHTSLW